MGEHEGGQVTQVWVVRVQGLKTAGAGGECWATLGGVQLITFVAHLKKIYNILLQTTLVHIAI